MRIDSTVRHCIAVLLFACAAPGLAGDVALIGVVSGKAAVLSLDGGPPKTVKIGQRWSGVRVISVARDHAWIEIEGQRTRLALGLHYRDGPPAARRAPQVTLSADPRGHFFADGTINGASVRFLVDTGATLISLPEADARRLGLDYQKGTRGVVSTANGQTSAWRVKLDTVALGNIELHSVDAIVVEGGLNMALLGMSFLNRVELSNDGRLLRLRKRF